MATQITIDHLSSDYLKLNLSVHCWPWNTKYFYYFSSCMIWWLWSNEPITILFNFSEAVVWRCPVKGFRWKHLCQSLFLNRVAGCRRDWHRCALVNFDKFRRTPFLQNTSSGCFYILKREIEVTNLIFCRASDCRGRWQCRSFKVMCGVQYLAVKHQEVTELNE